MLDKRTSCEWVSGRGWGGVSCREVWGSGGDCSYSPARGFECAGTVEVCMGMAGGGVPWVSVVV